jgi:hypothetical protein
LRFDKFDPQFLDALPGLRIASPKRHVLAPGHLQGRSFSEKSRLSQASDGAVSLCPEACGFAPFSGDFFWVDRQNAGDKTDQVTLYLVFHPMMGHKITG